MTLIATAPCKGTSDGSQPQVLLVDQKHTSANNPIPFGPLYIYIRALSHLYGTDAQAAFSNRVSSEDSQHALGRNVTSIGCERALAAPWLRPVCNPSRTSIHIFALAFCAHPAVNLWKPVVAALSNR
eukprot:scaffold96014_cov45-Prasinocladus_malaysianus.AAC.2